MKIAEDIKKPAAFQSVRMLIRSEYYWDLFTSAPKRHRDKLMAVETKLGWVMQRPVQQSRVTLRQAQAVMVLHVEAAVNRLHEELQVLEP